MHPQTIVLAALVVGFGCAQYTLAVHAIRDLARRPRVRGGNKVTWGLAILCLPIVGALIYGWMGPASFIRRAPIASIEGSVQATGTTDQSTLEPGASAQARAPREVAAQHSNVTPIRGTRSSATRERAVTDPLRSPGRFRRTGS